jgi:hypothetical protein
MAGTDQNQTPRGDLAAIIKAAAQTRAVMVGQLEAAVRKTETILADYSVGARVKAELQELRDSLVLANKTFAAGGAVALPGAIQPELIGELTSDHGVDVPWQNPAEAPTMFQASTAREPAAGPDVGTIPMSPAPAGTSIVGKQGLGGAPKKTPIQTWDDAANNHTWKRFGLKNVKRAARG